MNEARGMIEDNRPECQSMLGDSHRPDIRYQNKQKNPESRWRLRPLVDEERNSQARTQKNLEKHTAHTHTQKINIIIINT